MREAKDTILRQLSMLRMIPRAHGSIGTSELKDKLKDEGYQVDVRTIQRDLDKLSVVFPLSVEEDGRAKRWFWSEDAAVMDIPGMDPSMALAFRLAEEYLSTLLPQATMKHLEPHFRNAREIVSPRRQNRLGLWPNKVCVVGRGPELKAPPIKENVHDAVYRALLEDKQIEVAYKRKEAEQSKSYPINPLGLVFRDGVVYLVGTAKDYPDIRHFALHRMSAPKVLDVPCRRPSGFELNTYVKKEQFFAYPMSRGLIGVEALFEARAAVHLSERPMAKDQRLTEQTDGRMLLQATVKDTLELRWWLRGFGDNVEVLAPKALRDEFKAMTQRMAKRYSG
jgi:predicted DNA-binding transcriptional regulator YafY